VEGLLNNAGSLEGACGATVDGFEVATQVNYLAPALLTRLLLPRLEASGSARVVHVGCPVVERAQLLLEHLQPNLSPDADTGATSWGTSCDVFARYSSAKLMTAAFSATLAERLASRPSMGLSVFPVSSNVFDPVSVDTGFAAKEPPPPQTSRRRMSSFMPQMLIRRAVQWVLAPLFAPLWRRLGRLFMRSAETAGLGLVHVATSPRLARTSGKFYSLGGTALTRQAGCTLPAEQCGLAKPPMLISNASALELLWEATSDALAPWLPED